MEARFLGRGRAIPWRHGPKGWSWALLFLALIAPAAAREIVAGYRQDFQSGTMPSGWSYLWNAVGDIADPGTYAPLEADGAAWDTDASNPGRPDPDPGGHLNLSANGGHPGNGTPDRYAIAAFTVPEAGHYFLANTFLLLSNTNLGGSADGVRLRVQIGADPPLVDRVVLGFETNTFDADLGLLGPETTIRVAIGENGAATRDAFLWDFRVERTDSHIGSDRPAPAPLPLGPASPLTDLEIVRQRAPRAFFFRKPEGEARQKPYGTWRDSMRRLNGVNAKVLWEEINNLGSGIMADYTHQYAQDEPSELLLCHYNNESMDPRFADALPEDLRFHPAHWLYLPGSTLAAPLSETGTVLTVADGSLFRTNFGRWGINNDDIAIVPIETNGIPLWAEAEQVTLLSITGNQLAVERGLFGTTNRAHPAGSHVVPHFVNGPWGNVGSSNRFLWNLNFATCCPLDPSGRNAGDVMAELFRDWFAAGGPLERHHGIGFDVPPWDASGKRCEGRLPDADLDAQADGGVLYGENVMGLGLYDFYRKLRATLGGDRVITCDSAHLPHQRAVGLLDGMEAESFSGLQDPYLESWSERLNVLRYWQAFCPSAHPMSYVVDKIQDDVLPDPPLNLHRIQFAAIAAFDAVAAYAAVYPPDDDGFNYGIWDELRQGTNRVANWLGAPVGPMRRVGTETPDLLGGAGVGLSNQFVAAWNSTHASITPDDGALRFRALSDADRNGPSKQPTMTASLTNVTIGEGDLLVRFETKADKLTHFPADVPRWLWVTATGRLANTNTADRLFAFTGAPGWAEAHFYFRDAGPATISIHLEFEGRQDAWIRNMTVHNAADTMVREFDRGVVLVNPSRHPHVFDLASLFPGAALRRLNGSASQDPVTNNGAPVADNVTLGELDGLFLLKVGDDVDNDALNDLWELEWAGTLQTLGQPGTDSSGVDADGDGSSDAHEQGARTDPLDRYDRFRIVQAIPETGGFRLAWSSVPGMTYHVLWSTNLIEWTELPATYTAGPDEIMISALVASDDLPDSEKLFFAVVVR